MDNDLEKYYQNRFILFTSDGWKDLITDVQNMREATNHLNGATVENLRFKQGELSVMDWLLSLEEISHKAHEELHASDI